MVPSSAALDSLAGATTRVAAVPRRVWSSYKVVVLSPASTSSGRALAFASGSRAKRGHPGFPGIAEHPGGVRDRLHEASGSPRSTASRGTHTGLSRWHHRRNVRVKASAGRFDLRAVVVPDAGGDTSLEQQAACAGAEPVAPGTVDAHRGARRASTSSRRSSRWSAKAPGRQEVPEPSSRRAPGGDHAPGRDSACC